MYKRCSERNIQGNVSGETWFPLSEWTCIKCAWCEVVDSLARGDGYLVADVNAAPTKRQTQSDFYYAGVGSAGERGRQPRAYDAEYNQRNNDVKSSTLRGYAPSPQEEAPQEEAPVDFLSHVSKYSSTVMVGLGNIILEPPF